MMFFSQGKSSAFAAAILLQMIAASPMVNQEAASTRESKRNNLVDPPFEWGVVGDSWASGVAYSASTVYKWTDWEACYRTNQAWGALMEADKTWTNDAQKFHFAGCGGTLMDDMTRQMGKTGNSALIMATLGGNNAQFGDIARACIYQPKPGGWGKYYDEDPDCEGWCCKNLKSSRAFIASKAENGFRANFTRALDDIMAFKMKEGQAVTRFDLYISSYVQFFDATTDDCDKWTFANYISAGSPKVVKALRAEMNDLVVKFNAVQADVIKKYKSPKKDYNVHYIEVSDQFQNHRFCEKGHSYNDQYNSSDVWIWNLSYKDGDTDLSKQPPGYPNPPQPIMGLDTTNRTAVDNELFSATQAGFGWTARPFHPKPLGYNAMKEFFVARLKKDKIPGVKQPTPPPRPICRDPLMCA